jgi:hypothetical protein
MQLLRCHYSNSPFPNQVSYTTQTRFPAKSNQPSLMATEFDLAPRLVAFAVFPFASCLVPCVRSATTEGSTAGFNEQRSTG